MGPSLRLVMSWIAIVSFFVGVGAILTNNSSMATACFLCTYCADQVLRKSPT